MKKKVLITGISGMLGSKLKNILIDNDYIVAGIDKQDIDNKSNFKFYKADLLDFQNLENIIIEFSPDIIIHCAAIVNVDLCEENKELAFDIHVKLTEKLSQLSKKYSKKIIYISTDSIFDGEKGNYKEQDVPNPINYYAFTKYEGENKIIENCDNYIIARTNIYGFKNRDMSGNSLVEWAYRELKNNKTIYGFEDVIFNPVYVGQLSNILIKLIEIDYKGIINITADNNLSKYDFLIKLCEFFNFDKNLILKKSSDIITFKAKRPKITYLNNEKLRNLLKIKINIDDGFLLMKEDLIRLRSL